jgi:hypothetical protein
MTRHFWTRVGVAALALTIACGVAWWAYKGIQKRELQRNVVALVQDSTARLREALRLLTAGAEAPAELKAHFSALEGSVGRTQALDGSLHPALVQAADAYVTDVHALLRRQLALYAGREAVRADISAINNHLRAAGTRSPEWIRQALALNQRLEKSFFDYRFAAGGLEKSLSALEDTSRGLRIFVPASVVIEDDVIVAAEKRLLELSTLLEQQVGSARKLPADG